MIEIRNRYREPWYRFCRGVVSLYCHLVYKVKFEGTERVPREGALVLACNHIHNLDPLVVGIGTPRFVHFMAKQELFRVKLIGKIILSVGGFPVKRGQNDKQAIRTALAVPNLGECIVIFPEGHRSKDGRLQPGLPGVAFIARKSRSPVLPVAVIGPYRFRSRISVRFGEPFTPGESDTNDDVLEAIMTRIQALVDKGHIQ